MKPIRKLLCLMTVLCLAMSLLPGRASAYYTLPEINKPDTVRREQVWDVATETSIPFDYEVPENGVAMLIFFNTTCSNCQYFFPLLNEQSWAQNERIAIYALEDRNHTFGEIRQFGQEYIPDVANRITWMEVGHTRLSSRYNYICTSGAGWMYPMVILCTQDESGQKIIRYAGTAIGDINLVGNSLEALLEEDLGSEKPVTVSAWVEEDYDRAAAVVETFNAWRAEQGLEPLRYNRLLTEVAMLRSAELSVYYDYSRPDETTTFEMVDNLFFQTDLNRYDVYSGQRTPEEVLAHFMEFALGYNGECLGNPEYTQLGVGCVISNGYPYWTVLITGDADSMDTCTRTGIRQTVADVAVYASYLPDMGLSAGTLALAPGTQTGLYLYNNAEWPDSILIPWDHTRQVTDSATGQVIATVEVDDRGQILVNSLAEGDGTLQVWAWEGQEEPFTARIAVSSRPDFQSYTIEGYPDGPGTLTFSSRDALPGDLITVTCIPDEGYWLGRLNVRTSGGEEIPLEQVDDTTWQFRMPSCDTEVRLDFLPDSVSRTRHSIATQITGPGLVDFWTAEDWAYESETVGFWIAEFDYEILRLEIIDENGTPLALEQDVYGNYSFIMPDASVTVVAEFGSSDGYALTLDFDETEGSAIAEPARPMGGQQVTVTVLPNDGYELSDFYLDLSIEDPTWLDEYTLTFTMPWEDISLYFYFEPLPVTSGTLDGSLTWKVEDGVLTVSGQGPLSGNESPWSHLNEQIHTLIIEPGVTELGYDAFSDMDTLTTVTIPATVEYIDSHVFLWCDSLNTVYLEALPSRGISDWAFSGITARIIVPECSSVWTEEVTRDYFGDLTWNHSRHLNVTEPTCTQPGITEWVCVCGASGTQNPTEALGHDFEDGFCWRCGEQEETALPENPFADVKETDYFFTPVLWAVENGITAGTSATTFAPAATCTRAQVVTFLWRAAGRPEPEAVDNPFSDVAAGDYFYTAVLWAVENGITAGTSATTFSPNAPCSRAQVVTFLWRALGKSTPGQSGSPFTDVASGIYYYEPVLWAVENGITSGTGPDTFAPDSPCTRGQVVTFLYRAFPKE